DRPVRTVLLPLQGPVLGAVESAPEHQQQTSATVLNLHRTPDASRLRDLHSYRHDLLISFPYGPPEPFQQAVSQHSARPPSTCLDPALRVVVVLNGRDHDPVSVQRVPDQRAWRQDQVPRRRAAARKAFVSGQAAVFAAMQVEEDPLQARPPRHRRPPIVISKRTNVTEST